MPPRPVIAYVVNSLNPGGTERLVCDMSLAFRDRYEVEVYCLDEPGAWARDLRRAGIRVTCLWRQPGLDLGMPVLLARDFRVRGTALVHAHQCTPWFYAALARLLGRGPRLLLEEHGRFFPEHYSPLRALIHRCVARPLTHRFIAVSADIADRLRRYEGLQGAPIEVVYNGVQPAEPLKATARAAQRAALGLADADFVVGTVGRFDPIKNLPMLVAALKLAQPRVPRLRALLVGDGPVRPALEALLREQGLTEQVHLTGYRPDARQLLQCMDLFVLSSLSEGTSMALLEAMAAGVPVAVTRVGGNPECVPGPAYGWVVESGDAASLSAAVVAAATEPAERCARARAAAERFRAQFTFAGMIDRYDTIYREMLGPTGRGDNRGEVGP
ncbi:MAG: glycosyltransferase [Proteobacteria bacterium]|nr:glycosyltransferase [Pseudomonadota bacterium]